LKLVTSLLYLILSLSLSLF